jgi:hypothetical protein
VPTSINEPHTPAFEEVAGQVPPAITSLSPDSCAIGDPDFQLHVTGEGLSENTTIFFAGHDEPTTYNEDGTVSTGVKPSLWGAPVVVQVYVRNGTLHSNPLDFTFAAAGVEEDELPSDTELARMTRGELDDLAEERGVDITDASNKDDVIALLHKDAKRRRRKR